ncbi:MAG: AAA family ATPase [Leptospiraceae bacterium]|nr:AAA family ATPase [Leptospiraceae bacterium]
MKVKERVKKILDGLNEGVFEKEEVIKLSLLSAIAGESIFLLGLPGVAKSLIARRLKFAFKDAKSFEYLMNRFSTPDEIFGPVSVIELQKDNYKRITENYLPDAHIAFLDEIWKAGPAIQNTLLTVLNEKIFHNGKEIQTVPLRGLIAASNELPTEDEGLEALWDRFLIRYIVTGVEDNDKFNKMISDDLNPNIDNIQEKITEEDYKQWTKEINQIILPEEVYLVIEVIRKKVQAYNNGLAEGQKEIYISDRRWRKTVRILRASAFLNDRIEVDLMDCFLIQHCIWNEKEEIGKVKDIVAESIRNYGYSLTIDIEGIENQIIEKKTEVDKESHYIKTENVKQKRVYTDTKKNQYYKLLELGDNYNLFKIADYKKLTNDYQSFYLYNPDNVEDYENVNVLKVGSKLKAHLNRREYDIEVETEVVEKQSRETRRPSEKLINVWNGEISNIIQDIQNQILIIEKHRSEKLENLQTNLFVNKLLSNVVEENLHNSVHKLQDLKLEVEKIKADYDGLE